MTNLESRATSKTVGTTNVLIGYTAWVRLTGRNFVLSSPGCYSAGAGFGRTNGGPETALHPLQS